ncbi:CpsD/CapB family tyrosine-protein kinase [Salipaludibacillus sp. HK11]|uniref:CpsD/CapB family tyrosine-protein kinase n=1 Tax=Salipaludibacillus sp. HK11 TaxID=3394320 RepID=UPI0039FBBC97
MFKKNMWEKLLLFNNKSEPRLWDDYQQIKSNIEFTSFRKGYQSFSIISPQSGEGKTMASCHLAMIFASEGHKVLLIDGNLAKPMLHHLFEVDNGQGLSNVLVGQLKLSDAILKTRFSGLNVLPSGPDSKYSKTMFQTSAMESLLDEAKTSHDYIFIDNSSALVGNTGKLISSKSDGTVLVIKDKRTDIDEMIEAKIALEAYEVNILGVIFIGKKLPMMKRVFS